MPKTILIVEDEPNVRTTLVDILTEYEYKVVEAANGEEAIEKAKSEKPDVAIIDTLLPGIDGFETCKRIKAIEGLEVKVIVNTGKIDAVDALKAREMGADDYTVKTGDFSHLLAAIKSLSEN